MPDHDALAELHAIGLGELTYGTNPGCAGSTHSSGGAPRQCTAAPTHSVEHQYGHRPVKRTRLLVCANHARLGHDARPLTTDEVARDARRRAAWRAAWDNRLIAGQADD